MAHRKRSLAALAEDDLAAEFPALSLSERLNSMSDDGSVKFWRTQCKNGQAQLKDAQAQVERLEEEARHRAAGGAADGSRIGQAHTHGMNALTGEQAVKCPACGVQLLLAKDLNPEAAPADLRPEAAAAPGAVCPNPACNSVLNLKLKLVPMPA